MIFSLINFVCLYDLLTYFLPYLFTEHLAIDYLLLVLLAQRHPASLSRTELCG